MYLIALFAMLLTVVLETAQQLAFKQASRQPERKIAWTSVGIVIHVPHLAVWFFSLSLLPLTIAAPLLGASYVTVPLASQLFFRERVTPRRWLGIAAIVVWLLLVSKELPS